MPHKGVDVWHVASHSSESQVPQCMHLRAYEVRWGGCDTPKMPHISPPPMSHPRRVTTIPACVARCPVNPTRVGAQGETKLEPLRTSWGTIYLGRNTPNGMPKIGFSTHSILLRRLRVFLTGLVLWS